MNRPDIYIVLGTGSIARRHIGNFKSLFSEVQVGCISASGRAFDAAEVGADIVFESLDQAIAAKPALAVVASPSPFHVEQAVRLLRAGIPTLIEKPLSDSLASLSDAKKVFEENKDIVDVAYNLRYMPSAIKFKSLLDSNILGRLTRVAVEVGQYLPDWRPGSDYRKNVSARKELGGGVLLELSHELDYLNWIFGQFDTAYCTASNSGRLEVDVEDSACAILEHKDGFVAVLQMDFLQRTPTRTCKVVGELGTLVWDLLSNSLTFHGASGDKEVLFSESGYNRNAMYLDEINHFVKVAAGELAPMVDISQAFKVMGLIEALKKSAETKQVVKVGDFQL
ncbi:Gfo/Idh/MocA family oxidoreductase [Pseudomonas putida]|uniref:Gfo/Idh/MocA family protein n=1 Tax=Pseudomonas putida TaxID=303 RepID=UPI0018ABCF7F|nr:Gfo/Idh/MocA family oxidoreductase [Pseudomonas putida]MBF8669046.1 Gfo/Idh/MocA family oxidoreductase [Pseudomonas putida]MBF8711015.1 Gfo/Idh/MocA family oxidoreductase [Pseudomonas putida]